MFSEKDLAMQYAPYLYFDNNEPFTVDKIGYSVIRTSQRSPSFPRDIRINKDKVDFVIEYALYYDYDIQHLYDLEHFWVYVDYDGNVCDGETSAHGNYFNCFRYSEKVMDGTHIPLFVQPGKHAMLPEGNMFKLFGDYEIVCNERAGVDGLLIPDMFEGALTKDPLTDYAVCKYIREKYSFQPSLTFYHLSYSEDILMTWEELYVFIPQRLGKILKELGCCHI